MSSLVYGFGFSKKSNEYKMIHIKNQSNVEVCVLDGNPGHTMIWKNIDVLPYDIIGKFPSVYFDGALFWIAENIDDGFDSNIIICRFDVEDEKFHPIKLPINIMTDVILHHIYEDPLIEIGVLGDDFYFLQLPRRYLGGSNDLIIDIWLMKENGVNDYTWTKHLVIQLPRLKSYHPIDKWISLIKLCENGEILMVHNLTILVLYDPLTKSFRDVKFNFDQELFLFSHLIVDQKLSFSSLMKLLRAGKY